MPKGQKAMAVAFQYPEPEKGGRGKTSETKKLSRNGRVSDQRISDARAVLRYSRELAIAVRD
jgi:hypothetical protein